jgi:hypothetical protein
MIMTSHAVHVEDPSVNYHPVLEENGTMKEEIGLMNGEWDESNFGISGDRRTIRVWSLPNTKTD